jgi:hypothetical protein
VATQWLERWWDGNGCPSHHRARSIWLRGLGVVYLSAFASLAVQLDGLIGSQGILPAAAYLERAGRFLGPGPATYWRLPTLLWLDASDRALHALCWGGVALSVPLIVGILPGLCLVLLWVFYLSLTVAGQVFLGYQWDGLLLESGLLAVLLTPWGLRLGRAGDEPWRFAVWLVRWLVFRLMFLSGVVKLASGDPAWWAWRALDVHYETQPLATWTSWYIHQMPSWFHGLSVGFMFYAELIAPWFIFGPRPVRLAGFASLMLLQILITATGNYGFFNLLAMVLCLALLDDRDWDWVAGKIMLVLHRAASPRPRARTDPVTAEEKKGSEPPPAADAPSPGLRPWSWPRRAVVGTVGGILVAVTAADTLKTLAPAVEAVVPVSALIPTPIEILGEWIAPLRSTNRYGLFAVMTTRRPEIIVEGSDDGMNWKPYDFRWKPGERDRRPRFTTPHMPRLDWQMWFAALAGDCERVPWFHAFTRRLLSGTPAVLDLLGENPFPDRPPQFVRARLYLYAFTRWGSADWWARQELGLFCIEQ